MKEMVNDKQYCFDEVTASFMDAAYFAQQLKTPERAARFLIKSLYGDTTGFMEANYLLQNHINFNFYIGLDGKIQYEGIDDIKPQHILEVLKDFEVNDTTVKQYEYCEEITMTIKQESVTKKAENMITTHHRFFITRYLGGEENYIIDGGSPAIEKKCIKAFLELIKAGCSS